MDSKTMDDSAKIARGPFGALPPTDAYALEQTYWGYVIRPRQRLPYGLLAAQLVAWVGGITLVLAAVGLWLTPMEGGWEVLPFRVGVTLLFGAAATILFWFASRGTRFEMQVDLSQGEVREVVRNRMGSATVTARYGFDTFGGVFIDRSGLVRSRRGAVLALRFGQTAQVMTVAMGREADLTPLRDRLGRDLIVHGKFGANPLLSRVRVLAAPAQQVDAPQTAANKSAVA